MLAMIKNLRQRPDYLPHVDGLRAVAVLGVLFYHLDFSWFSGGFAGVDVFFVISGFLITSHIRQSVEAGQFRFRSFYGRRVRRLAPALLATVTATLAAGFFILSVADYQALAQESVFAVLSVSNFLFWSQAGYFDTEASLKPLLHTWSLAVEEQYYLLWPLLLVFLRNSRAAFIGVLLAGVLSLLAAEFLLRQDAAMAFFLMPFRIVEFTFGGLLYWCRPEQQVKQNWHDALAGLGLVIILWSFIVINDQWLFPGLTALIPCLGTALIIAFGRGKYTTQLLGWTPVLFVGLISYSIYLVHWPLIVLYKYVHVSPLEAKDIVWLIIFTLLLAIMQYVLVEYPFRHKQRGLKLSAGQFATVVSMVAGLAIVTSAIIIQQQGWSWRYQDQQLSAEMIEEGKQRRFDIIKKNCQQVGWDECRRFHGPKGQRVLVTGDSHAADALNILATAYPDYAYSSLSLGGCPPLVPEDYRIIADSWSDKQKCIELNEKRLSKEFLQQIDVLVIGVYFEWYRPEHLWNTYRHIQSLVDIPVVVLGNYIVLKRDYPALMANNVDPRLREDVRRSFAAYEDELQEGAALGYRFISKRTLLCQDKMIQSCKVHFGTEPFTYDEHHLSLSAALYAAGELEKQFPDFSDIIQH